MLASSSVFVRRRHLLCTCVCHAVYHDSKRSSSHLYIKACTLRRYTYQQLKVWYVYKEEWWCLFTPLFLGSREPNLYVALIAYKNKRHVYIEQCLVWIRITMNSIHLFLRRKMASGCIQVIFLLKLPHQIYVD